MTARSILRFGARIFFVRRKLVFEARMDDIPNAAPRIAVRFRFGDERDLLRLSGDAYDYDQAAMQASLERLRAGDRLVLAESKTAAGTEIVFYGWLMSGQMDMGVRRYLPLSTDTVYSGRLFTAVPHRGKKLCAAYFTFVRDRLLAEGRRRMLAWVEARNHVSQHVHEVAGFRNIGCIWHIQFLFRSYFFVPRALRASLRGNVLDHTPATTAAGASRA